MEIEREKLLNEYLQHVRLIHLSLLVVCATITYLVLSTWSTANELVADLNEFTHTIEEAAQSDKDPQKLAEILPEWQKIGIEPIQSSIEQQLGSKIIFDSRNSILRILSIEPGPLPSDFNSLENSRSELERRKWNVEVPDHIQSDLSDLRRWVSGMSKDKTPEIRMHIKSWPIDQQPGHADIEAEFLFVVVEYESDINGNIQPRQSAKVFNQRFDDKEWMSRRTVTSIPSDWFATRFPWMTKYWNNIKSFPYSRALDWANDQRTEELRSRNPSLFGIEIKGEHIGYVGPALTACLLMYLISFLTQLEGLTKRTDAEIRGTSGMLSPWVGTMTNLWALLITWITLVIGPFVAVGLPLWRQLGVHWYWAAMVGFCAGLIGLRCAWISQKLVFR